MVCLLILTQCQTAIWKCWLKSLKYLVVLLQSIFSLSCISRGKHAGCHITDNFSDGKLDCCYYFYSFKRIPPKSTQQVPCLIFLAQQRVNYFGLTIIRFFPKARNSHIQSEMKLIRHDVSQLSKPLFRFLVRGFRHRDYLALLFASIYRLQRRSYFL